MEAVQKGLGKEEEEEEDGGSWRGAGTLSPCPGSRGAASS